ncbi:MAG: o-succinylbenzoate--CoA ligase [candidate division Zixibacteria bacterium]
MDTLTFHPETESDMSEQIECPIKKAAESNPNAIALSDSNSSVTYKQLYKLIQNTRAYLFDKNIGPGDTVACLARNSIEQAIFFWACFKSGIIFLPLNWRLTRAQLNNQLEKINCRLLLFDKGFAGINLSCEKSTDISQIHSEKISNSFNESDNAIDLNREVLIVFSAGTTSEAKGVVLTAKNLYFSALGLLERFPLEKSDCWLAALPFFHVGGISILMRTAMARCSTYIMPSFQPDEIIELCRRRKIILSVVPTMMSDLIRLDTENCLKNARAIIMGGAGASQRLIDKIKSLGLPVLTTYGMTETSSMITLLSSEDSQNKPHTAGKILPYREIRISRDSHIQVKGKTLFAGFTDNSEINLSDDGWFDTADIGEIDENGFLHVMGRSDDMIISGGENISLSEIENALLEIDFVKAAAVIKHDHEKWGQYPVALVEVSSPNEGWEDIKEALSPKIPGFMMPREIHILNAIPLNAVGKIDRNKLSRMLKKY